MNRLTGYNIVSYIDQLPKNICYNYINPKTKGVIKIVRVKQPGGPITIKRWTPANGESEQNAKEVSISAEMIWRIANAFLEGQPINFDRILGASYNTRSVLETLLAYTPQFYYCYPGRISDIAGKSTIEHGHKHIVWLPKKPHKNAKIEKFEIDIAISEIPSGSAIYDALFLPNTFDFQGMDIDIARRHTQIQIALYLIGLQFNYRTWIAQNDKGIIYQEKRLIEQNGIVKNLYDETLISSLPNAVEAGLFIDCIWFKENKFLPAVMEVEHSTGVTSGLTRMLNFYDKIPAFKETRYVIVAPDEDRQKVVNEANKSIFRELDVRYFPYSSVEELYSLCQKRKITGMSDSFLDCYMEKILIEA